MLRVKNLTHERVREVNCIRILQYLRRFGEATKGDLENFLGVSHTTINTYIQDLINEGYIGLFGTGDSSGGRKPALIRLLPDVRYAFGVNVTPQEIQMALVNLTGETKEIISVPYPMEQGLSEALNTIAQKVFEWIHKYDVAKDAVLGIGMAFPGLVDDESLVLEYLPNLKIKDYSMKDFQRTLDMEIFLENEANTAAYAEYLLGNGNHMGNFVYVSIADGIGAGIMVENCIFRGNRKRAGEFGHIKVSDQKKKCSCGREGCWELFASKRALLGSFDDPEEEARYLEHLFYQYDDGNQDVIERVDEYVKYLFSGLGSILLSLDPYCIIIGGDLGEYAHRFIEIGTEKLKLVEQFFGYESIKIIGSALPGNGALLGAALLPFEQVFNFQRNVL